jgi:tetratricopeptide (TPR) repeat protein
MAIGREKDLKALVFKLFFIVCSASAFTDSFSLGEDLFMRNNPSEAAIKLESAIRENPDEEKAYLYLGVCYQQTGRLEEAIGTLRKGAARSKSLTYLFYFNLGNCYFSQGKNSFAKDMYDQALKEKEDFGSAYLNRANTRMNLKDYKEAVQDYSTYLSLVPDSPQKDNIQRVISLVGASLADAERARAEEEARIAMEEAKKLKMLSDVAESLKQSADDTKSMSAGAEGAQGYSEESELAE